MFSFIKLIVILTTLIKILYFEVKLLASKLNHVPTFYCEKKSGLNRSVWPYSPLGTEHNVESAEHRRFQVDSAITLPL
jgi:hypothetical protein